MTDTTAMDAYSQVVTSVAAELNPSVAALQVAAGAGTATSRPEPARR